MKIPKIIPSNPIEKICNNKLYSTKNAERIGSSDDDVSLDNPVFITKTLYRTPKGQFFITVETGAPDERIRTDDSHLYDGRTEIIPVSKKGAYEWAREHCLEALARLMELGIPEGFRELVLLADFRRGTCGEKNYIHHVVYKLADGSGYVVGTDDPEVSAYPESQTVVVCGVEGVEDFAEDMYLHDLTEAEAKEWAGCHLPVEMYVRLFGPVEAA